MRGPPPDRAREGCGPPSRWTRRLTGRGSTTEARSRPADFLPILVPVTRATAVLGGLAALLITLAAFGFAMFATSEGSALGGLGKAVVLALSASGIAAACGGVAVAAEGIASRAWLLHALAVLLAGASYVVALSIAEMA